MKKQVGIWIDLRHAYLVSLPFDGEEMKVVHLRSDIEESEAPGGFRGKTPWSPQGGEQQRAAQERRHHEEKEFFEHVLENIPAGTQELVIFGPSKAKFGLQNVLEAQKHFHPKLLGVEAADQMTEHQMTAWVREFFHRAAPQRLPRV